MGLNHGVVFVVFFLSAQCQVSSGQWFRQLFDALDKREHFVVKSPPKIQPDVKLDHGNHDVMLPMDLPQEDVHFDLSDPLSRPLRIQKSGTCKSSTFLGLDLDLRYSNVVVWRL